MLQLDLSGLVNVLSLRQLAYYDRLQKAHNKSGRGEGGGGLRRGGEWRGKGRLSWEGYS